MNTTDSCPRCLRSDIEPAIDAEDYWGNPHSSYRCPGCGHRWVTRRIGEPEPGRYRTPDDPDAWEAEDDFTGYDRERGWL